MSSASSDQAWLSELQTLVLGSATLRGFLEQLAQLTVRALPADGSCGITVAQDSQPVTVAASDDVARRIDQVQYDLHEGPCLDTLATGHPHYIADIATEPRWRGFCRAAHEHGVRSCLALPLNTPDGLMGGYNLYSTQLDGFSGEHRRQLEVHAGNAAGAVAIAAKLTEQAQLSDDLRRALTSRAVIDRATGIIMAQQRCDAETAFDLLRRASQNRNLKIRELAAEIVTAVSGAPPEPGRFQPRHR